MAAGSLSAPGTKHGPCAEACIHRDCGQSRLMSMSLCVYCKKPIGYSVPFYVLDAERNAHATCHEAALEALKEKT